MAVYTRTAVARNPCVSWAFLFFLLLVSQYYSQTVIGPLLGYFMNLNDFLSFVHKYGYIFSTGKCK